MFRPFIKIKWFADQYLKTSSRIFFNSPNAEFGMERNLVSIYRTNWDFQSENACRNLYPRIYPNSFSATNRYTKASRYYMGNITENFRWVPERKRKLRRRNMQPVFRNLRYENYGNSKLNQSHVPEILNTVREGGKLTFIHFASPSSLISSVWDLKKRKKWVKLMFRWMFEMWSWWNMSHSEIHSFGGSWIQTGKSWKVIREFLESLRSRILVSFQISSEFSRNMMKLKKLRIEIFHFSQLINLFSKAIRIEKTSWSKLFDDETVRYKWT